MWLEPARLCLFQLFVHVAVRVHLSLRPGRLGTDWARRRGWATLADRLVEVPSHRSESLR